MAQNPYVNKVEYAGQTLMDLTGDTATPSDVLNGATFHDRSGAPQTGSLITHNVYDGLDSDSSSDALSAKQGKALNTKINNHVSLFSNAAVELNSDLSLSGNLYNYQFIFVRVEINGWINEIMLPKSMVDSKKHMIRIYYNNDYHASFEITFVSSTSVKIIRREASANWSSLSVGLYIEGLIF